MNTRIELNAHSNFDTMDSVISVKELAQFAKSQGMPAIALTDLNCVQGFLTFERECKKTGIKPIFGAEIVHGNYRNAYPFTSTVLVKNQTGLKNLYRIISELKDDGVCKNVPVSVMEKYHDGLLYGTGDPAILSDDPRLLSLFDYFEIRTVYLTVDDELFLNDQNDTVTENRSIIELAEKSGKPVVAVTGAGFINKDDEICLKILGNSTGKGSGETGNRRLCNTGKMLLEFSYLLGHAEDFVINNTRKIADQIEDVKIIPDEYYNHFYPYNDNAYEHLHKRSYREARIKYGKKLPEAIAQRLEAELSQTKEKDWANELWLTSVIVKSIDYRNEMCHTRGTVASSFLAYCLGITKINPLPSHYYCPECKKVEWVNSVYCGVDLPPKECSCGRMMRGDGFNIPYEMFFGSGRRMPDINICADRETQDIIVNQVNETLLHNGSRLVCAGAVNFLSFHEERLVSDYEEKTGIRIEKSKRDSILDRLRSAKLRDGINTDSYLIIPNDMEITDVTPTQTERYHGLPITHLNYYDLNNALFKFDIVPTHQLEFLHMIGMLSTEAPATLRDMVKLFRPESIGDVSVLDMDSVAEMIDTVRPASFADLVKIYGLAHTLSGWDFYAKPLIKKGVCKLSDIPACRDDVFIDLTSHGLPGDKAFLYAEAVGKGRLANSRLSDEEVKAFEDDLRNIGMPDWYIDYCKKTRYLFPKAHIVEFSRMALIELWYKEN